MRHTLDDLLDGMRSPDPDIRDGWAYTELSEAIQSGSLNGQRDEIRTFALTSMRSEAIYARSFAPLILRWLVLSSDRDPKAFDTFVTWYLTEEDTRGYDEDLGWLHAVAHGADYIKTCVEAGIISGNRALEVLAHRACGPGTRWADQEDARILAAVFAALATSSVDVDGWCHIIDSALDEFESNAAEGVPNPPTWLSNVYGLEALAYVAIAEMPDAVSGEYEQMRDHAARVIRRMTPWLFN